MRPDDGSPIWSLGGHFRTLAGSAETAVQYSLVQANAFRSKEPPLHIAAELGVPAVSLQVPAGLSLPAPEVLGPIAERFGIEVVGPPLRLLG